MRIFFISTITSVLVLSGCQNTQHEKTGLGIGIGALLKAGLVYPAVDNTIVTVASSETNTLLDQKERQLRQALVGTGVNVNRNLDGSINLIMPSATFASSSANIQPQFQTVLSRIVQILRENGSIEKFAFIIHGHTDSTGNEAINNPLSQERAGAVLKSLAIEGILLSRMSARGYGASSPIADNSTAQGRERNRRVEITIYVAK